MPRIPKGARLHDSNKHIVITFAAEVFEEVVINHPHPVVVLHRDVEKLSLHTAALVKYWEKHELLENTLTLSLPGEIHNPNSVTINTLDPDLISLKDEWQELASMYVKLCNLSSVQIFTQIARGGVIKPPLDMPVLTTQYKLAETLEIPHPQANGSRVSGSPLSAYGSWIFIRAKSEWPTQKHFTPLSTSHPGVLHVIALPDWETLSPK